MTPGIHDRIVTPDTDPDRFTEDEAALFRAGKCGWLTAYGLPWMKWCEVASKPGASFGNCDEHDAEMLVEYYPDGTPRRNVDPFYSQRPEHAAREQAALEAHQRACEDAECSCREREES